MQSRPHFETIRAARRRIVTRFPSEAVRRDSAPLGRASSQELAKEHHCYGRSVPNQATGASFKREPFDSPIRKAVFPLIAVNPQENTSTASGTCVRVGPRLALTARHVVVDWLKQHEEGIPIGSETGIDPSFAGFAIETLDRHSPGAALWGVGRT